MSAIFHWNVRQNTPEWFALRMAVPTASEFHRIITPEGKKATGKQREVYMARLLWEYVSGFPCHSDEESDNYQSPWMENGHDYEAKVAQSFELMTGYTLETIGGISNWDGLLWASPDRVVRDVGCFEAKSPAPWTQLRYLLDKPSLSKQYWPQVQGQIFVGDLEKQFIGSDSYRVKAEPVILDVGRDDKYCATMALLLREFVDEMLERRLRLKNEFGLNPPIREVKKELAYDDPGEFGVSMADVDAIFGRNHHDDSL